MGIKVSVIVPVYQVEDYIARCLDSLCAQDLDNIEFLLVVDGSTDRSGAICDEYASKDSRFKVFYKENGGLSSARNYGIDRARGKFLMFVDSDDWVRSDFCRTAYECAIKNNSDLVMFCREIVHSPSEPTRDRRTDLTEGHKTFKESIDLLLGGVNVYAWNKLYKRSLFEGIRYPEGRLFEDQPVAWKLVYKAKNVYFTNKILYYYFMREGSIVHQVSYKATKDNFEMRMQFYEDIKKIGYSSERLDLAIANAALSYALRVKSTPNDEISVKVNKILRSYKKIPDKFSFVQKVMMLLYLKSDDYILVPCPATVVTTARRMSRAMRQARAEMVQMSPTAMVRYLYMLSLSLRAYWPLHGSARLATIQNIISNGQLLRSAAVTPFPKVAS